MRLKVETVNLNQGNACHSLKKDIRDNIIVETQYYTVNTHYVPESIQNFTVILT